MPLPPRFPEILVLTGLDKPRRLECLQSLCPLVRKHAVLEVRLPKRSAVAASLDASLIKKKVKLQPLKVHYEVSDPRINVLRDHVLGEDFPRILRLRPENRKLLFQADLDILSAWMARVGGQVKAVIDTITDCQEIDLKEEQNIT